MFMKEPVSGHHDKVAWPANWNLKVWLDVHQIPQISVFVRALVLTRTGGVGCGA